MKVVVLVDGEHYPPVTRWAIDELRGRGLDPIAALFVGGGEKLDPSAALDLGIPLRGSVPDRSVATALAGAIDELGPEGIFDLSDEPVLGYRERMEVAAVALARGVAYLGPDFRLDPPVDQDPLPVATIAVIGIGKRTGKTAVSGETARVAAAHGFDPVVVAMGRGGPPEPEVAEAGTVTLDALFELVRRGFHAASDYLEIAVTSGVTTVGAVPHEVVVRWLQAADVVCQPSLVEPFGLATLEAMACGRSVVATRVGGPPEFVRSGAGVLVDPEDEDALVEALEEASRLPRPNLVAREAATAHDVVGQVERIEGVLRRAAPAAAGAVAPS